jgi:hypothetical protein
MTGTSAVDPNSNGDPASMEPCLILCDVTSDAPAENGDGALVSSNE